LSSGGTFDGFFRSLEGGGGVGGEVGGEV